MSENLGANRIRRWYQNLRRTRPCIYCLELQDEPTLFKGCSCRGLGAFTCVRCAKECAIARDDFTTCDVCGHPYVEGPVMYALLCAWAEHTNRLPNDHPDRISAIVALAYDSSKNRQTDVRATFGHVLLMAAQIKKHPMWLEWHPQVYMSIAACLQRLGRHGHAGIQMQKGYAEALAAGGAEHKSTLRLALECAILCVESSQAERALEILGNTMPHIERVLGANVEVTVFLAPLTLSVSQWMHALQKRDVAGAREAQQHFELRFATARRTFGGSHPWARKWSEWRDCLMSPREW